MDFRKKIFLLKRGKRGHITSSNYSNRNKEAKARTDIASELEMTGE